MNDSALFKLLYRCPLHRTGNPVKEIERFKEDLADIGLKLVDLDAKVVVEAPEDTSSW